MSFWSRIFVRNHNRDCQARLASEAARELSRHGVNKRRQPILAKAAQMRRELRLPPSPALRG